MFFSLGGGVQNLFPKNRENKFVAEYGIANKKFRKMAKIRHKRNYLATC
jgi:hypothetical protein